MMTGLKMQNNINIPKQISILNNFERSSYPNSQQNVNYMTVTMKKLNFGNFIFAKCIVGGHRRGQLKLKPVLPTVKVTRLSITTSGCPCLRCNF